MQNALFFFRTISVSLQFSCWQVHSRDPMIYSQITNPPKKQLARSWKRRANHPNFLARGFPNPTAPSSFRSVRVVMIYFGMVLHISCGASQKGLKIHSFEPSCNGKWVPSLQGFIFHWTVLILQGNHLEIVFHRSKKERVREGHGLVMTRVTLQRFENVY